MITQADRRFTPAATRFFENKGRLVRVLAGLVAAFAHNVYAAAEPIVVKPGQPELFVDDYLIESKTGLQRRLHQAVKDDRGAKPVLSLRDLGITNAGTLEANGSILYDTRLQKYVMFALALRTPWDGWDKTQLFRFTSRDGIKWMLGDDHPAARMAKEDPSTLYPELKSLMQAHFGREFHVVGNFDRSNQTYIQ